MGNHCQFFILFWSMFLLNEICFQRLFIRKFLLFILWIYCDNPSFLGFKAYLKKPEPISLSLACFAHAEKERTPIGSLLPSNPNGTKDHRICQIQAKSSRIPSIKIDLLLWPPPSKSSKNSIDFEHFCKLFLWFFNTKDCWISSIWHRWTKVANILFLLLLPIVFYQLSSLGFGRANYRIGHEQGLSCFVFFFLSSFLRPSPTVAIMGQ